MVAGSPKQVSQPHPSIPCIVSTQTASVWGPASWGECWGIAEGRPRYLCPVPLRVRGRVREKVGTGLSYKPAWWQPCPLLSCGPLFPSAHIVRWSQLQPVQPSGQACAVKPPVSPPESHLMDLSQKALPARVLGPLPCSWGAAPRAPSIDT